jgi:hypothetical protein
MNDLRRALEGQVKEILAKIDAYENNGSDWVLNKPLSLKVRFIKRFDWFNRAKGFNETPEWLKNRKAIINIKNTYNNCFFKCIYRHFNRDKYRHDYRDIPMDVVNNFLKSGIDKGKFNGGITAESLRVFEETTRIAINIFYIDERGPDYTKHDYVSIYNDQDHDPVINFGYITKDDKSHYILITNLKCIVSEKYHSHKKLICSQCNTIFSRREALLNHAKKFHSSGELPIINLPKPENAQIKFDISSELDLKKTIYYPFVCYADFEASNM